MLKGGIVLSLNIERADYYSLDDACSYLSLKHKVTNITARKLLKKIISYQIPVYIYARGFNIIGDFETNIPEVKDEEIEDVVVRETLTNKVTHQTEEYLSALCESGYMFLQLDPSVIELMPLNSNVRTNIDTEESFLFIGALNILDLYKNSRTLDYLQTYIEKHFGYYVNKVLALYPRADYIDKNSKEDALDELNRIRPRTINQFEDFDADRGELYFDIAPDDLIILHRDLSELEEKLVNDVAPNTGRDTAIPIAKLQKSLPRKGVGVRKLEAKRAAWLLAQALWEDEPQNEKTRIADMAFKVYAIMNTSDLKDQLPNHAISLKEWIADNAPKKARQGGRPKLN